MDEAKRAALLAAIDLGSITAAAEKLGYTQSGMSYVVAAAEGEMGFPLLDRSRSGVRPTAACRQLLPLLRELARKDAMLAQVASDIRGVASGELSLAIFPSISRYWLPRLLKSFEKKYPGISVRLQEGGQEACDRWLRSGEAELVLGSHQPGDGWQWVDVAEDDIVAILPTEHPLANLESLSLSQVEREPFILLAPDYDYDIRRTLEDAHFTPNIRFISRDEPTVIAMVQESLGISILPGLHLRGKPRGVAVLPLAPRAVRRLGIAFPDREALSPAARRFLELAIRELAPAADFSPAGN